MAQPGGCHTRHSIKTVSFFPLIRQREETAFYFTQPLHLLIDYGAGQMQIEGKR